MTILDIEAIEHLDFDLEDVCEAEGCDDTPVWSLTLPCCFFTLKICDGCLTKHNRWLNISVLFGLIITHQPCGKELTADELRDTQIVVPL
jgi:hypothetical protein